VLSPGVACPRRGADGLHGVVLGIFDERGRARRSPAILRRTWKLDAFVREL
jgi:hypothetical protein